MIKQTGNSSFREMSAIKRFTLDTNCIIDVEDARPNGHFVRLLVEMNGKNGVKVSVSAIGASERQRTGGYARSLAEFNEKLKAIDFGELELLPPLAYWDVCFWDHCIAAEDTNHLEQRIHEILFPNIEFSWAEYAKVRGLPEETIDKNWRNAKCDVLGLWCHIWHGGGVFVTSDTNFHAITKKTRLLSLGVGAIANPQDALRFATESAAWFDVTNRMPKPTN